jgi:hypothetical protein
MADKKQSSGVTVVDRNNKQVNEETPTFHPTKHPFAMKCSIDTEKCMKTEATCEQFHKFLGICEMERRLRIKGHRLISHLWSISEETWELIEPLIHKLCDLNALLQMVVYPKKQKWCDTISFSSDPDVKGMVSEDFLRQVQGVLSNRHKESGQIKQLYSCLAHNSENLPDDFPDKKSFQLEFLKEVIRTNPEMIDDTPPVWTGPPSFLEEEVRPEQDGSFCSDKQMRWMLSSSHLNETNPLKDSVESKIKDALLGIFCDMNNFDFSIVRFDATEGVDDETRAACEAYAKQQEHIESAEDW